MSGFGYVRDQKPNVVDWANVGREMGKTLELEFDDRRKRKEDINQQDRDFAKELLDQPQGSYAEANRFISDFSSQASQQALNDLKLLKTGEISEREYYKRRANLTSGTEIMFLAGQKFNENYESAMKSIQDGSSSVLLADLKSKMEGYTNFANHGTYINPLTGTVNVSSLDENGVVSSLKGNFMDASELLKLSTADFKNFELDKRINDVLKGLGKLTYRGEDGTTKSVSMFDYNLLDKTEQDKFKREMQTALTLEVDSIVGGIDSKTAASILADHSGGTYNLVFNGEYDKDGKLIASSINENNQIAYDVNGNIQLTDDQLKKAKDLVQRRLQQGLDASILEKPKTEDTSYDKAVKDKDKEAELSYEIAYDITLGGDKAENNKQIIKANNDKIEDLNETEDSWVIEYNDGTDDKIIQKIKKTVNGVETYDREATAEALYTIVDPNSNPIKAQKARQNYFKTREIKTPVSTDLLVSTRQPTPAANTTNYYTNQEATKINNAVPISAEIDALDMDIDASPKIESIIRGIQPLPGAENFFDKIRVRPAPLGTRGTAEIIRVELDNNLLGKLKEKPFVNAFGDDYIDIRLEGAFAGQSAEEGKSNLNQLIDALILEMTNKHNANKGVKSEEEKKDKRTIAQIIKEDGVTPEEALKIFNKLNKQ